MLITCILTSFNRPNLVRQSLQSLKDQSYQNFELIVMDDSSVFDIKPVVDEFKFPRVQVFHTDVTAHERATTNRLGINCNRALSIAKGDLVCFLCDDDYYFPSWFEMAVHLFRTKKSRHPYMQVGYGRLVYSTSMDMVYPTQPQRWPGKPIERPGCILDHNQVIHERMHIPVRWPESAHDPGAPDAQYFNSVATTGFVFYPMDAYAVVKRQHGKNLQHTWGTEISKGLAENVRE